MYFLISTFCIMILIYMVFMVIMFFLSDQTNFLKEKIMPFECGVESFKTSRVSFSSQFFFIGIVFILFDMEIIFLIHFLNYFNSKLFIWFMGFMVLFVVFMFMTLLMEWKWASLNWVY